jgi:hypothetical protein
MAKTAKQGTEKESTPSATQSAPMSEWPYEGCTARVGVIPKS